MTIELETQPDAAARELFHFLLGQGMEIPSDVREKLVSLVEPGKSPAFAVAEAAELIYARKKDLSHDLVRLGAKLASTADYHKINSFGDSGGERGRKLSLALRRYIGEKAPAGSKWPLPKEDPEPKEIYVSGPEGSGVVPAPEPGTGAESRTTGNQRRS